LKPTLKLWNIGIYRDDHKRHELIINDNRGNMIIVFTEHALDRMEQRGITEDEIRRVVSRPLNATRGLKGEMRAEGLGHGRVIKVVYHEKKGSQDHHHGLGCRVL
jgi:hypothetical protein